MQVIWFKSHCMKKELYIQIPEPCHEDWNKMTPVDQGRYCQSCCKEVVNFSAMTDQEIISFLSKPRGKTCGNFSSDQLNRIITEPATPAKKKFWAMMLSFLVPLFVVNKAKAQFKAKKSVDTTQTSTANPKRPLLGKVAVSKCKVEASTQVRGDTIVGETPSTYTINGIVTDEKGNPVDGAVISIKGNKKVVSSVDGKYSIPVNSPNAILNVSYVGFKDHNFQVTFADAGKPNHVILQPFEELSMGIVFIGNSKTNSSKSKQSMVLHGKIVDINGAPVPSASIEIIGKNKGTATDINGDYNLQIRKSTNVQVRISAIGYVTRELAVSLSGDTIRQDIALTPHQNQLDEVTVTAVAQTRLGGYYAGGISIVREKDIVTKVIDTVSNLVNPSIIKIYPNPASKNSFVNVKLSQKGEYHLNLVDNNGKTIQQNKFSFSNKNMIYQLELPQSIAAGIYYITITDEKTHKQYTQKLIVQ